MEHLFNNGVKIIQKLKSAGFDAYFVGGAVRDRLLNREINDIDIATNAKASEVINLFKQTIPVGEKHGTVIVRMDKNSYEVSTFKSNGIETPSLFTDLAHRDITINALALTEQFKVIDPYEYRRDIKDKVIRAVGSAEARFMEDPLRMLRAIRFVAQLGFQLEEKTKQAIMDHSSLLEEVAIERITIEFDKILEARYLQNSIPLLVETNLYEKIAFLKSYKEELNRLAEVPFDVLISNEEKWAVYVYFSSEQVLSKTALSNKKKREIKAIIQGYKEMQQHGWTSLGLYNVGLEVAKKIARLEQALNARQTKSQAELEAMYHKLPIHSKDEIHITGLDIIKHCNKTPGPWINNALLQIEVAIVNKDVVNEKYELLRWLGTNNVSGIKE